MFYELSEVIEEQTAFIDCSSILFHNQFRVIYNINLESLIMEHINLSFGMGEKNTDQNIIHHGSALTLEKVQIISYSTYMQPCPTKRSQGSKPGVFFRMKEST